MKKLPKMFVEQLYEDTAKSIKFSLINLLQKSEFRDNINTLKNEGWLDWEILVGVKSIVLTFRKEKLKELNLTKQQTWEKIGEKSEDGETENDDEVPMNLLNLNNLRTHLISGRKELGKLFKYRKIDVKHDDFFDLKKIK